VRKRVAIIGGGVSGLAAAVRLRDLTPPGTELIVYEQSGALGGKLRTGKLGGVTAERGAESFLMSAPDGSESAALALVRRLDLEGALRHPAAVPAALAIGGDLARIPGGTLIGVPGNVADVGSVAQPATDRDLDEGRPLLAAGEDVAVGELVRARYGDQVVDRLVDPLLGGIYAGRADRLSLAVTIPQLARTARIEHTLQAAVRTAQAEAAARRAPGRPVFGALDGGMSRLVAAAAAASGARISLGLPVREVARTGDGWRLVLGPTAAPQLDEVDAVVLAVPSRAAAKLLTGVAPEAGEAIGVLDYASVALVGMAFPAGTKLPELSGFLVPPSEGTLVKAATFVTRKWSHLAGPGDPVLVRASLGRAGEAERLQFDDTVLIERAHRELCELTGVALPAPAETFLQRWGGGLPQYPPGHLDRVAQVRGALPDGLAVAGASLDGVGIPACIASGERAAEDVHKALEEAA
jgi:oxygen-dependent protoporphyrinogen oxidase